jgi:hypothetical protein
VTKYTVGTMEDAVVAAVVALDSVAAACGVMVR